MNTKNKLIVFCLLFSLCEILVAEDLSKPYNPTRAEWLEIVSYKVTSETISLWAAHVSVKTNYIKQDNTIIITLSTKNGELPLSEKAKNGYIEIIKTVVESCIYEYSWANEVKVLVQFL